MTPADGPSQRRFARLRIGRIALDITPLRTSRDFRVLWIGLFVSDLGYQFALVAMFVQVYRLTGSAGKVGLIGLFSLVALIAGSIVSGAVVDAYDRRKLLMLSQVGLAIGATMLLAGALAGRPSVWLVYAAASITAGVSAVDNPTRSAMTPRLVGTALVPSAMALNQVVWNAVGLLGPAVGGVLIAHLGLSWAYGFDLVTYGAAFLTAILVAPMPPVPLGVGEEATATGWAAVKEGFAFVRDSRLLQSTFAIDLIAMIFGLPRALFVVLAATQFHRGPQVVGLLFSAPALGALLGALTGGWVKHVSRQGMAVVWAVIGWGASIAAFGLVGRHLALALVFLAMGGWADVISAIFRSTILQLSVPERLRGRLSAIHILVVTGGPRLGDFEAGVVAQVFSPALSVVSGGLACIVGAGLVAAVYSELRRYRARTAT
ncbi:MAG: MFS transporter [Actinomycetota bacterium]|nr:MFS transporter [Actinomycetota bacterium]